MCCHLSLAKFWQEICIIKQQTRTKNVWWMNKNVKNQKQSFRGVLSKKCSENMLQIYRRTLMSMCDFNKVSKQLYWIEITLWHGRSPVNFLHIFRTPFSKNTSGGLLLDSLTTFSLNKTGRQKMLLNYFCFSQSSRKDVDAQIVNSDVFYCFSTYLLRVLIVSCFLEIKWQIFLSQLCDTKSDLINCVLNNNWYLINTLNAKFLKCFDQIQNCVCKISCTA